MSPSGPPNPNGGNKSLSSSLRRSNSGYLVSQGSPLTSQTASATATALSRQIQFNGMNMLGNGPNAPSPLNQSFGNGGSGVSHRASMSPEAESDPLSNRMAFVSSSFISADAGNNRTSNQVQSQTFQSSVGNQMLPDQQERYQQPQSQDSQSLQHNQQLSLQYFSATHNGHHRDLPQSYQRNRGVFLPVNFEQKSGSDFHGQPFWNDSAKLEPHTHSMRGLAPAKAEPHQSDRSLYIQQQQQLLHLSRQPPLNSSVAQMDIMNQHRLLQLQEQDQQHLGVIPQQQMSQLHQQFPTQNLSLLDPEKPPYEPGSCAHRLTQFMYHQRHRPLDNNIDFWRQFVSEYFAPHAKMKWCVSMYESGRPISHVFRQDVWHCGICNRNPGRGFEATAVVLSRLFKVKYESGTFEELLYVDMPREEHDSASGQTILHCAKATHESVFDQLRVVRDGQLRIVFSADLKICSWEFCTRQHEELIPRGVLLPLVRRRLGAAARKYHDASQKSNPSLSAPKLQSNCNTFVSSARNSAKALDVPLVNDLGYTRRYLRFLQISEVVNSMVDLIDYSRETGTGPMESLVRFPRRTNSSAHRNGPSQHGEDGQPLLQQLQPITTTLRNNDCDQGLQQAASNGALSAGNILSSPTSLNTGPRLLHRNYANSSRQNSLSNGQSSYRAGRHQAFDPSNTLAQVHSTVAPSHTAGAIAPSNNPQPMSSDSVPLRAPEADGNESQRMLVRVIVEGFEEGYMFRGSQFFSPPDPTKEINSEGPAPANWKIETDTYIIMTSRDLDQVLQDLGFRSLQVPLISCKVSTYPKSIWREKVNRERIMYQPSKDMKSLSICSIYKESFNIISSKTKLFTQIAVFITFPLSLISIFATPLSSLLFPDININNLTTTNPTTTNPYDNSYESLYAVASSWTFAAFLFYKLASIVLTIALSLLSFSSVTYVVACICTEHTDVTFKTTLCAFKRAWKKLLLTSLAEWSVMVGYTFLMGLTIIAPIWAISSQRYQVVGSLAILIISLIYAGGLIYVSIIWIFGGTVAILESSYGFKALSKSRSLIKGKAFFTIMVLIPISSCSLLLSWMFTKVVVNGGLSGFGIAIRIACGVVGLPLVVAVMVFAVVVRTVTYLVCKADKGESITKSSVMEHLDIYVDGYASLSKDEI